MKGEKRVSGVGCRVSGGAFGVRCSVFGKEISSYSSLALHSSRQPTPDTRTHSPRSGLTLIEVLLALVILGTGLVALVTAAGRCISVARQAKNYETARELLAVVEVEHPMMLEEEPEEIAGNGSFEGEHAGFRWERTAAQEGFEEDGLWRVNTKVFWTENESARHEEVVQLIYWPEGKKRNAAGGGSAGGNTINVPVP